MRKAKILVVEDEAIIARDLQLQLEELGYYVPCIVATGEDAIEKAEEIRPDLVLMDIMLLGHVDGIEAATQIRSKSDVPIVYLSAYADNMLHERAKDTDPFGYLSKPVSKNDLHNTIEMALYKHSVERKLREEKEFTEKAIDAQMDTFFVFDFTTGKAVRWNKRFREISGYTDEEIASMKAPDAYYSQEDLEKAADVIEMVINKGQGKVEISLICRDGKRIPTEYIASAIRDEKNNIKYIISVGRDITVRKQAEEALRASEEQFRTLVEKNPHGVQKIDIYGTILFANKAHHQIYGYEDGALVGRSIADFLVPVSKRDELMRYLDILIKEQPQPTMYYQQILTKHGNVRDIEVAWNYLLDSKGCVSGFLSILTDITERKLAEDKREKLILELKAALTTSETSDD